MIIAFEVNLNLFLLFINLRYFDLLQFILATFRLFLPPSYRLLLVDKPLSHARLTLHFVRYFESNFNWSFRSRALTNFVNYHMYDH